VHPAVLDAYSDGSLFDALKACATERREEECVMQVVTQYVQRLSAAFEEPRKAVRRRA
jgi:hypothetical protein